MPLGLHRPLTPDRSARPVAREPPADRAAPYRSYRPGHRSDGASRMRSASAEPGRASCRPRPAAWRHRGPSPRRPPDGPNRTRSTDPPADSATAGTRQATVRRAMQSAGRCFRGPLSSPVPIRPSRERTGPRGPATRPLQPLPARQADSDAPTPTTAAPPTGPPTRWSGSRSRNRPTATGSRKRGGNPENNQGRFAWQASWATWRDSMPERW